MVKQGVRARVALLVDGAAVQLQRIGVDGDAVVVLVFRHYRVGEHQCRGGAVARGVVCVAGVRADGQRQARRAAGGVDRHRLAERHGHLDDLAGLVIAAGGGGRRDRRTGHRGDTLHNRALDGDAHRVTRGFSPCVGKTREVLELVRNRPTGLLPQVLGFRCRSAVVDEGADGSQHHRVGLALIERGILRSGEGHRSRREGARRHEVRTGRRGMIVAVDPAHLRREIAGSGGDDVDAGQGVRRRGCARTDGESLRTCGCSCVGVGVALTDVADQNFGLCGGGEREGAGEREQRRGGERAGETRRPAGGGCTCTRRR